MFLLRFLNVQFQMDKFFKNNMDFLCLSVASEEDLYVLERYMEHNHPVTSNLKRISSVQRKQAENMISFGMPMRKVRVSSE